MFYVIENNQIVGTLHGPRVLSILQHCNNFKHITIKGNIQDWSVSNDKNISV